MRTVLAKVFVPVGQDLLRMRPPVAALVGSLFAAAVVFPWLVVSPNRVFGVLGALVVLVASASAIAGGRYAGLIVGLTAFGFLAIVLDTQGKSVGSGLLAAPLWATIAFGVGVLTERLLVAQEHATLLLRTDPLTGVANRRSMNERLPAELERATREGRPLAVGMVDLDNFKGINDLYGHRVGDAVLTEVARRIQAAVRSYDLVTRWGGDEFCLLFPSVEDDAALHAICKKICSAVGQTPIQVDELALSLSASVGAVRAEPGEWFHGSVLEAADQALYSAKQLGGSRVRLFSELDLEADWSPDGLLPVSRIHARPGS